MNIEYRPQNILQHFEISQKIQGLYTVKVVARLLPQRLKSTGFEIFSFTPPQEPAPFVNVFKTH